MASKIIKPVFYIVKNGLSDIDETGVDNYLSNFPKSFVKCNYFINGNP